MGKLHELLTQIILLSYNNGGVLSFHVFTFLFQITYNGNQGKGSLLCAPVEKQQNYEDNIPINIPVKIHLASK